MLVGFCWCVLDSLSSSHPFPLALDSPVYPLFIRPHLFSSSFTLGSSQNALDMRSLSCIETMPCTDIHVHNFRMFSCLTSERNEKYFKKSSLQRRVQHQDYSRRVKVGLLCLGARKLCGTNEVCGPITPLPTPYTLLAEVWIVHCVIQLAIVNDEDGHCKCQYRSWNAKFIRDESEDSSVSLSVHISLIKFAN